MRPLPDAPDFEPALTLGLTRTVTSRWRPAH